MFPLTNDESTGLVFQNNCEISPPLNGEVDQCTIPAVFNSLRGMPSEPELLLFLSLINLGSCWWREISIGFELLFPKIYYYEVAA
uniref:Uncharacterized protein n=1 Tax=Megaselia scalaris TaxID=36166 RepID=T1GR55_MEGSC